MCQYLLTNEISNDKNNINDTALVFYTDIV